MSGVIQIDHRELSSGIEYYFIKREIDYEVVNNQSVDYIIGAKYGIERKTVPDFFASIFNKRIFRQAHFLRDHFSRPLFILEGSSWPANISERKINATRGVMLWLSLEVKVPLIRTRGLFDSAEFIRLLFSRANRSYYNQKSFTDHCVKKSISPHKQQIMLLSTIGGLGSNLAGNLIKEFGSVKNIIQANEDELLRVTGIGRKRVKCLQEILGVGQLGDK